MPAAGSPQPNRPKAPKPAATKPLQVIQINRREEQEKLAREAAEARAAAEAAAEKARILEERAGLATPPRPVQQDSTSSPGTDDDALFDMGGMEGNNSDILAELDFCLPWVKHIQIAAIPDRTEPDHGDVDYQQIYSWLDAHGYDGFIGAEYKPRHAVEDGLGWLHAATS